MGIIELETASDIHWWKGICRGSWEILATSGDNHGPKTATMTMEELDGAAFYKAGFLGVHTWRHILAVEGGFQEGKKYSFFWKKSDWGGSEGFTYVNPKFIRWGQARSGTPLINRRFAIVWPRLVAGLFIR